ncbi:PH and SEC7 domain-containing protein 4-like isoform X1 [Haemorhous mexicanus]|uniref:PH and SEC7 domain-containing protein 4-like isoform X1 n=1 Tax=Haemorhous mexicanus TaxID=30427 RepID=UPI0028BEE0D8|nr:PH and SEC7 domain-containing protein 4-like isoform X1 [Haemorhous mexicanus]
MGTEGTLGHRAHGDFLRQEVTMGTSGWHRDIGVLRTSGWHRDIGDIEDIGVAQGHWGQWGQRGHWGHRAHGDFLRQERQRCLTYVQALGAWLRGDSGDSATLGDSEELGDIEGPLGDSPEGPHGPAPLTKCHSSPSLAPEPPPGRVRRHISERRATRVIVPKRHRDRL